MVLKKWEEAGVRYSRYLHNHEGKNPMTRRIQKLITVLFFALLCGSTASSQEELKSSLIYSIASDGVLMWHRHDGAAKGTGLENPQSWIGRKKVGDEWNDYVRVFPGGGDIIYGIKADGTLEWRRHRGFASGDDEWYPTKSVGRGWNQFADVFAGGDGVIYVVQSDGILRWYRHVAYRTGGGLDSPGSWATPRDVGRGWTNYKHVFSGGNGIIYVIANDGTLKWYRHKTYLTGEGLETPGAWEGPKNVGRGWGNVERVFSSGDGVIYAIATDGKLWWYRHYGYMEGQSFEISGAWSTRKEVGHGWNNQVNVFALLPFNDSEEPVTERQGGPKPSTQSTEGTTLEGRHPAAEQDNRRHESELRCRGGGSLHFNVVNGRVSSSGEQLSNMSITFTPASRPVGAGARTLLPGQCAFVERTLRVDEPNVITQEVVYFAQLRQQLHGTQVDTSPTAAERYPDAQNIPQYLAEENHYWSFFVVQSAPLPLGKFVSTSGNHWKPAPGVEEVITHPIDARKVRKDRVRDRP